MKPILIVLMFAALAVCAYTFTLGWRYHYGRQEIELRADETGSIDEAEKERIGAFVRRHFILGMISGVVVSLVHSIVLTYFLGTGKAIKDQMEQQGWGPEDYETAKKLMARAVIPACIGIALIIVAAFSGGFTMIGMLSPESHLVIALIGVFCQLPIFARELAIVHENGKLMDRIVERLGEDLKLTL